MIAFASSHFGPNVRPNLRFEIADARSLPFRDEFDLVVSLNALHWIREQDQALRSIRSAMKSDGVAQLRLVSAGKRKSLENVIEETRLSSSWARYFQGFSDPYLHLTPGQYGALAERNGLHVCRIHTEAKAWDFKSRSAFLAFGSVTFVEWTQFIPEAERLAFRHRCPGSLPDRGDRSTWRGEYLQVLSDGCHAFARNVRLRPKACKGAAGGRSAQNPKEGHDCRGPCVKGL
jgi:trans-aconitate 2-methyltransferase